jgi:hypothetical protein
MVMQWNNDVCGQKTSNGEENAVVLVLQQSFINMTENTIE